MVRWEETFKSETHAVFGAEHLDHFCPCKTLGFFTNPNEATDELRKPMVLLHACMGLMQSGKQNTRLTKMWQLGCGLPKTIQSPIEMNGTRKRDNQGKELSHIRICNPDLHLESMDGLGHCSFITEEHPGI